MSFLGFFDGLAPHALALALVFTTIAAAVQGTVGFGFALLTVPLLSLLDPRLAPVPQLLVVAPLVLSMLWRERKDADLKGVVWVLAGRLPGAALKMLLLKVADHRLLDVMIAACVLAAVAVIGSGRAIPRKPVTELITGIVSGTSALISSIGGPPLALLYRESKMATLRASLAAIYTVGLAITTTTRALANAITLLDLKLCALMLLPMFFGLYCSRLLTGKVKDETLRAAILIITGAAGSGMIIRAIFFS